MEGCFASCSCDDSEGLTKADLDRFTDKLENVLNDEKGRRLFRNFMITCKMKDGRKALNLWEHNDRLLVFSSEDSIQIKSFIADVEKLIDEAEDVEELDFAIMERLTLAHESRNVPEIKNVLKLLKQEIAKCLKREYNAFRSRYVPK